MGTIVHPAKLLWELLSTVPKWNGNFCPQCQTCVGTIVHPVKNGMGTFVHGNYCPIICTQWWGWYVNASQTNWNDIAKITFFSILLDCIAISFN